MQTLLVTAVVLLTLCIVLLIAVALMLVRVLNIEARKRGMLDSADLFRRRKRWYA